jgi:hypothetical protein
MQMTRHIAMLLLLIAAILSSATAMPVDGHGKVASGGCHEHGKRPARQPSDYACCVAGHSFAVVRATVTPQALLALVQQIAAPRLETAAAYSELRVPHALPGFLPGSIPLRV